MDYKSQIMRVIINHPGATRAYIEKHCGGKHSSTTTHRLHEMLALGFIRREKSVIRGGKWQYKYFISEDAAGIDDAIKCHLLDNAGAEVKEISAATGIDYRIVKSRIRIMFHNGDVTRSYDHHKKLWRYSWREQEVNVSNLFNSLLRSARGHHGKGETQEAGSGL